MFKNFSAIYIYIVRLPSYLLVNYVKSLLLNIKQEQLFCRSSFYRKRFNWRIIDFASIEPCLKVFINNKIFLKKYRLPIIL